MIQLHRNSLRAGFLIGALMAAGAASALPDTNTIVFRNCTLNLPGTTATAPARCGWLEVPENPEHPEAGSIRLHVALAPAVSRAPEPDPLFYFAGGPGQAAGEAYVGIRPSLEEIRKRRDIVLVDQRGTGKSSPLKCPLPDEQENLLETSVDQELIAELTRKCLAQLDGDPRYYTTSIAMQDIDRVRAAMGYERINLMGGSYGTRTAQVYLRLYPERVRSVILDSVVPMDLYLGQEHAMMLDRAVAAILADCRRDETCNSRYGDGSEGLAELMQDLRVEPRRISFVHPSTGEREDLTVTADVLATAIRFLSYSNRTQAVLPLLLHEAVVDGRLNRLASQALIIAGALSEQIARGMELSVICSEDFPHIEPGPAMAGTILGDTFYQVLDTACREWPRGPVSEHFHRPVTAPVPVLLLAGEWDPVTPPEYAHRTAQHFPDSLVLVAAGQGHGVSINQCMRKIVAAFIDRGSLQELDISCVDAIGAAPYFTSLLGPGP